MGDRTGRVQHVLEWFVELPPERRRMFLEKPVELSPRRIEKRAELLEWIDQLTPEDGIEDTASALVEVGLYESEAEDLVRSVAGFDTEDRAEGLADERSRMFEMVGSEVLDSYTGVASETRARAEFDAEDVTEIRLLLSRTVVAVSCGDVDLEEARERLQRSGAEDEAVEEFVERLSSRVDDVDLHLRRARVQSLSEEVRSLRWDSLVR